MQFTYKTSLVLLLSLIPFQTLNISSTCLFIYISCTLLLYLRIVEIVSWQRVKTSKNQPMRESHLLSQISILEADIQIKVVSRSQKVDLVFFYFCFSFLFYFWFIFLYSICKTRIRVRVTRLHCHTAGYIRWHSHNMYGRM